MPDEEGGGGLIHVAIQAERLFTIGPFEVTNSMVGAVLASLILLAAAWYIAQALIAAESVGTVETGLEMSVQYAKERFTFGRAIGLLGEHEGELVPFIRPASADLNFTLALSIITFVVFVWWAIRVNGPIGYLKELTGEPRYMAPLMFPIHLISEVSRLVSLSMRLFGNIFAGEVLLATMLALTTAVIFVLPLAFFVPAIFLGLEILIGVVQALVFALLAMTYITIAIAEHEGGHGTDEGEHGATPDAPESPGPAERVTRQSPA